MSAPPALDGATAVYGILGHPVRQSLSPAMHNAAFGSLSINAAYLPFPTPPEKLEAAVSGLSAADVKGFNLTTPHKTAILPMLAEIRPAARAIGAVNTVRNDGGRLSGANTDGEGFLRSLAEDLSFDPAGKEALLLGAGGAARAIAFALLGAGVSRLVIANRTPARAESLAADCRGQHSGPAIEAASINDLAGGAPHLLVNATTVGMGDGNGPGALEALCVREAGAGIVYHPLETPLLTQARALGLTHTNGIGMLLYQGAAAFTFWTGREAPVKVMRAALLEAAGSKAAGEVGMGTEK